MEHFEDSGLAEPLLQAVRQEGYTYPTPIQQEAIPPVMAGRDLLGCAQTGTGKTAAFALPILHRLAAKPLTHGKRPIRSLVLTPTRELAAQIDDSFATYGRNLHLRSTVVFGGVKQNPQTKALERGVDILVATPGRLMDLMKQGFVHLDAVEIFVLDEADRMLDMGFIADVRRIVSRLPTERQTLLFSATMPAKVQDLADSILHDCVHIRISPEAPAAETVEHAVYFVDQGNKRELLGHVLSDPKVTRALVFTRTKYGADKVTRHLKHSNISAEAIHSNKSQSARMRALENFKRGKTRVLVASDIAARGIDIDDISHVINYDLPQEPEMYVHRIGRTGRAEATGIALTFCDPNQRKCLDLIEDLIKERIPTVVEHPWHSPIPSTQPEKKSSRPAGRASQRPPRRSGSSRNQRPRSGSPKGQSGDASTASHPQRKAAERSDACTPKQRRRGRRGRKATGSQNRTSPPPSGRGRTTSSS